MARQVMWVMAVSMSAALLGGCIFVPGGRCDSQGQTVKVDERLVNDAFTADGIPQKKFLVGGGLKITYTAPQDGTIYWVEETGRKVFISQSMEEGDVFDETLPIDSEEGLEVIKEFCGGDLKKARFTLYYVPAPQPAEAPQEN